MSLLLSQQGGVVSIVEESGSFFAAALATALVVAPAFAEEFVPPPGAATLTEESITTFLSVGAQPVSFPSQEEFAGTRSLEEIPHFTPNAPVTVWLTWQPSEEFAGSLPLEEIAPYTPGASAATWLWISNQDEPFVPPPAVVTLEEGSKPAFWLVDASPIQTPSQDEFAGSLPLEEVAPWAPNALVTVWLSWPPSEEFAGSLPLEEVAPWAPNAPVTVWLSWSPPEEFAGSLPLEEIAQETSPFASYVSTTVWLMWQSSEDFAGSRPLDEEVTPFTPSSSGETCLVWPSSEELFAGSLPLEEIAAFTSSTRAAALVWLTWQSSEEFVGTPLPPPPPPKPKPSAIVRSSSGSGLSVPLNPFWRKPLEEALREAIIETTADVLEDTQAPVAAPIDLNVLSERVVQETERPDVISWGRWYTQLDELDRGERMLQAVRDIPSADPLARVLLLSAGYIVAGLHSAIVAHTYNAPDEHLLVAVFINGAWRYADPNKDISFGAALHPSQERFATIPKIPLPVVLAEPEPFSTAKILAMLEDPQPRTVVVVRKTDDRFLLLVIGGLAITVLALVLAQKSRDK